MLLLLVICSTGLHAQTVTNFVMSGPDGITDDPKKATDAVIVKKMPDNRFERLDYKMRGSLRKRRTYKDDALQVLDGPYMEYRTDGRIRLKGQYLNNLRDGSWFTFNDTGGVAVNEKYIEGVLQPEEPKTTKPEDSDSSGQEAEFTGGIRAWQKYLMGQLEKSNAPELAARGGRVLVNFTVDTLGRTTDIFISQSVDYFLDEEAIKVISKSPRWIPAIQHGRKVKAWRRQPITFAYE